jgi:shikimate dehydrogenase
MKLYALFGNPVSHSRSPRMHNLAFKELGINGAYIRQFLEDGRDLRTKFESLGLSGANITVPHKEIALKACDEVRGIAKHIGAINTIVRENSRLIGYNTDAPGFLRALKEFSTLPQNALILGAGGTAKALSYALSSSNIEPHLLNRSSERLQSFLAQGFKCFTPKTFNPKKYDLIINTTPAGLKDNTLPTTQELLQELFMDAKCAIDVVYGQETPFLKMARNYNLPIQDGKAMLLHQGVIAFNLFHNNKLNEEQIQSSMQKALGL